MKEPQEPNSKSARESGFVSKNRMWTIPQLVVVGNQGKSRIVLNMAIGGMVTGVFNLLMLSSPAWKRLLAFVAVWATVAAMKKINNWKSAD